MNIKVIEGLEPWEVLKRSSEGDLWVARHESPWTDQSQTNMNCAYFISQGWEVAIIDTSISVIDWSEFEFDFFNQYSGLLTKYIRTGSECVVRILRQCTLSLTLRESPFYYWPGGEQPVPDNIEVEVIMDSCGRRVKYICKAAQAPWGGTDIIAFRITGNVL